VCVLPARHTGQGGPYKYPVPRALEESEIPGIVAAYATAASNALAAGFDGVEVRNERRSACTCCVRVPRHHDNHF
jgi:2,4-dienoyl-CoA reductase-like NADH-dependent reductase (Old Yellow Enzyme family)